VGGGPQDESTNIPERRGIETNSNRETFFTDLEPFLQVLDSGPTTGQAQKFPRPTSLSIEMSSA
jgi:hypothetical protein